MYLCKKCLKVHEEHELSFEGTVNHLSSDEILDIYNSIEKRYEISICPKASCNGMVVEVDELILPAIIELNKKGWKTTFCCSGHLYSNDNQLGAYISFDAIPPYPPESFYILENKAIYLKSSKFNNSSRPNNLKRFGQLFNINKELYEWAIGLPINA